MAAALKVEATWKGEVNVITTIGGAASVVGATLSGAATLPSVMGLGGDLTDSTSRFTMGIGALGARVGVGLEYGLPWRLRQPRGPELRRDPFASSS